MNIRENIGENMGEHIDGLKIAVSLVGFGDLQHRNRAIGEIKNFIDYATQTLHEEPYFELSYILNDEDLGKLDFLKGRVISVHAPCPGSNYFPNLGSRDERVIDESLKVIETSARTARDFGADFIVLHPGYATDMAVYMNSKERETELEGISRHASKYIKFEKGSVCKHEYIFSVDYRNHLQWAVKNLKRAAIVCEENGIHLAIENLNPRISYLFQTVDEIRDALEAVPELYACIDIGHLWISSLIHQFDIRDALVGAGITGRVISAHIHNNSSKLGNKPQLEDEHAPIAKGVLPVKDAIGILLEKGVKNFVIEAVSDIEYSVKDNFLALIDFLKGGRE